MIHVESQVPLVTDRPRNPTKPAPELALGDVIAVPFAGYGDLLCEVTEALEPAAGLIQLSVSDGEMSYVHVVDQDASVLVYPSNQKGQVRS